MLTGALARCSVCSQHEGFQFLLCRGRHAVAVVRRLYNTITGSCLATLTGHTGEISKVAFNPQGTELLTASSDRTCRLWDAESGECLQASVHSTSRHLQSSAAQPTQQLEQPHVNFRRCTLLVYGATSRYSSVTCQQMVSRSFLPSHSSVTPLQC